MNKEREALKQALELLAVATYQSPDLQQKRTDVINAGLNALAEQPAQQHEHCIWARSGNRPCPHVQPSKPLTDEQIGAVAADIWGSILIAPQSYQAFARAIEAAHGITGGQK